jgi:catechol 2,3-dioxygenase-like lactoylglutathione lyase family enzyme
MIDIGVVMTDLNGSIIDTLFVRIQPQYPERLSEGARRVNGFDAGKWRSLGAVSAPAAVQRLREFHRRVAGDRPTLMVAFNSQFDTAFVDHLFRASDSTWRSLYHYFVLDVPSMAWAVGFQDLANGELARRLAVADEPRVAEQHTGLTGAMLNVRIFQALRQQPQTAARSTTSRLTTLAFRVHHMAKMEAFYAEAFGFKFRDENTGGMVSRFGAGNGITIKLVPIRKDTDFVDFPVHQPGFEVDDVARVIEIARKHGGSMLQAPARDGGVVTGSVRDPDGNTIELYQRRQ